MESIYFWPDRPALSWLALWALSVVFLWAAREPMLQVLRSLGRSLETALRDAATRCRSAALEIQRRRGEALLASRELELASRIDRELHRIDASFAEKLGKYAGLQRRLDDLLLRVDADYARCGDSPPAVPGWAGAVEAVAAIPSAADPNVQKVLEGIRESMRDAERRALDGYRTDTAKRHKILGRMRPDWKEVRNLLVRMKESVGAALETTSKIERYVNEVGRIGEDRAAAARALAASAAKPFIVSLIVLAIALGGAFINFQLIALPMSELVPAGARIGGLPVSTISALVIVLMEAAIGIFVLDMLGITDLFPKLAAIPASRRRLILGLGLAGLFFLASVESSLAILREQIVEAEVALEHALAGSESRVVAAPASSPIPVVGQAVLGFVLPWILAMVAIPLEMLLESGRHVTSGLLALALHGVGHAAAAGAHAMKWWSGAIPNLYDAYVAIPLRIERGVRSGQAREPRVAAVQATTAERRIRDAGVV